MDAIARATLVNLCGFALLLVAGWFGYVDQALSADSTYLVEGIFVLFLLGLGWVWRSMTHIAKLKEELQAGKFAWDGDIRHRVTLLEAMKLEMTNLLDPVQYIATTLVGLGLVGTILGFIIALSGVDPATAGSLETVEPMVTTLVSGVLTALFTTLVGIILNIWLMVNYNIAMASARQYVASAIRG